MGNGLNLIKCCPMLPSAKYRNKMVKISRIKHFSFLFVGSCVLNYSLKSMTVRCPRRGVLQGLQIGIGPWPSAPITRVNRNLLPPKQKPTEHQSMAIALCLRSCPIIQSLHPSTQITLNLLVLITDEQLGLTGAGRTFYLPHATYHLLLATFTLPPSQGANPPGATENPPPSMPPL